MVQWCRGLRAWDGKRWRPHSYKQLTYGQLNAGTELDKNGFSGSKEAKEIVSYMYVTTYIVNSDVKWTFNPMKKKQAAKAH